MGLKLMCVVAHPDDECFAFGGALALAADRGVQTYVLCLTDGQAATARGSAASGEELGRIRREEFAASCKILGVTHHELLDYQDGRLEFVEFSRAAGRIVELCRLRPSRQAAIRASIPRRAPPSPAAGPARQHPSSRPPLSSRSKSV